MTNRKNYIEILTESISEFQIIVKNKNDLDSAAKNIAENILSAYGNSCPVKRRRLKRDIPWWNKRLDDMRKKVRRLSNRKRNPQEREIQESPN